VQIVVLQADGSASRRWRLSARWLVIWINGALVPRVDLDRVRVRLGAGDGRVGMRVGDDGPQRSSAG
jgi:hypothetical protein